ncbi:dTDP-4-dehydrorhamnose reductase [Lacinutrix iliipiscaria]|uniref:dTDP-4-dehydrorhamnose reductase n=1 Tax=Lacinutrix iliipiscaria TaxID=1230532 RepID=A0ABW5WKX7_9FLAO
MKTKILVTGSNGQLGQTIKALYANYSKAYEFTFLSKSDLDISNESEVFEIFKANNYNYCINCAAYTNVEQAEKTPELAFIINAEAVKNLAKACRNHDTILIHISTDYVFDGEKRTPYSIEDTTNPINEYGKSKLQGELYIKENYSKHFIVRTSWLYSKTFGKNFYKTILNKIGQTEEIRITDAQLGCPTNCDNLANYIYKIITSKTTKFGTYHYCDKTQMSWFDFAYVILKENQVLDRVKLIKDNNYVTFAKRPSYSVLKPTEIANH